MFILAIPVLHSSGAWIATAGGAYLAGTLSSTWIGSFILGNATLLSWLGLGSAVSVLGASGAFMTSAAVGVGVAAYAAAAAVVLAGAGLLYSSWAFLTMALGRGLEAVGLLGVAEFLGIAPVRTYFGLRIEQWIYVGISVLFAFLLFMLYRRTFGQLNVERVRGGLRPIGVFQLWRELRNFGRA